MNDPAWVVRGRTFLGTTEIAGHRHNPVVLGFWKSAHLGFKDDETPWCAGFVNAQLEESGIRGTRSGMAKSFLTWGRRLDKPVKGCVVVFHRPPNPNSGHVGFFDGFVVRNGIRYVRTLGGNQGNKVSYALFKASTVAGYRWPTGVAVPAASKIEDGEAGGDADVSQLSYQPDAEVPEVLNQNSASIPPAINTSLQVAGAAGTVATPFLAYATDWRVVAVVVTGLVVGAVLAWWLLNRAGKE